MDPQKAKVLEFLATQTHGVVSTIEKGSLQPESALVGFSETPKLDLIFGTTTEERKFKNILTNPHVTFVVGFGYTTIQYEGVAHIAEGDEIRECQAVHFEKHPRAGKYAFEDSERLIILSPLWIKYRDGTIEPDEIIEIKF